MKLSLGEVRKLCGVMQWLSAAFTVARADIGWFVHMRTEGEAVCARRNTAPDRYMMTPAPEVDALNMWYALFRAWDRQAPICMGFGPCAKEEVLARMDASVDPERSQCGGFMYDQNTREMVGFFQKWTSEEVKEAGGLGPKQESTGVLECMAVERWFRLFIHQAKGRRVLLETDNEAAAMALGRAYSKTKGMQRCVREVHALAAKCQIHLRVRWIARELNQIADSLSKGDLTGARCQAEKDFGTSLRMI